jgi:hypothetical protein
MARIGQAAPSRRFIKVYLCIWGLLAVGALAYLTLLAFPPQAVSPPQASATPPAGDAGTSSEIAEVKGSIGEIRKDVSELKTSVGERVENEKVIKTRVSALEERVSTIDGVPPPAPTDGSDQSKAAPNEGEPPPADASKSQAETTPTVPPVAPSPIAPPPTPPVVKVVPSVPIETGSIAPPKEAKEDAKEEIVFGEPVVTRGGQEFAVQLAAAPSLNALKQSWGQLAERHGGALANLKPRVVAPRADGGIYRLLAGPLPTKADAERLCSELRVGPKACFATPYAGAPL